MVRQMLMEKLQKRTILNYIFCNNFIFIFHVNKILLCKILLIYYICYIMMLQMQNIFVYVSIVITMQIEKAMVI